MPESQRRERIIQSYARWIRGYKWTWFCTLKLVSGRPSKARVKRLFGEWVAELGRREGGKDFRYFAVFEWGTAGDNPHVHVVVGGLLPRRIVWAEQWAELGGDARIDIYDASRDGVLYILKNMSDDGDLDCDFSLPR